MKSVSSFIGAAIIATSLVLPITNALSPSQPNSGPTEKSTTVGRRFFVASVASLLSATATMSPSSPANASWLDNIFKKEEEEFSYDKFRNLVQSKNIKSVQFSWNGETLTCVDSLGKKWSLEDVPNDPTLLLSLMDAGVEPGVDEFPFEKHMSTTGWFRDSVLKDDTLTYEEKYKYRGYKTFRQNIPENRVYIPSNLISN